MLKPSHNLDSCSIMEYSLIYLDYSIIFTYQFTGTVRCQQHVFSLKFESKTVCFSASFKEDKYFIRCDAIWENPSHVAQGSFAEINKIILKLLCFSLFFMNFDNM